MATGDKKKEADEAGGGRILIEAGQYVCPECQAEGIRRTFGRAQALGAHRQRSHGVEGSSSAAHRAREKKTTPKKTRSATKRKTSVSAKANVSARKRKTATTGRKRAYRRKNATRTVQANGAVDTDALLGVVFPNGLPHNRETIQRALAWLDEAEAIARL